MSLDRLLAVVAEVFAEVPVEHAVIGGCARNAYAPERATRDVDLSVAADEGGYARLVEALARRGFAIGITVRDDPSDPIPDVTLFRDAQGGRIDLLFAKTPFERAALARRVDGVALGPARLPVVTPEDLIVFKLAAGRAQDLADAEEVARTLALAGRSLDWPHIEKWCAEWEVTPRLIALRERLGDHPERT